MTDEEKRELVKKDYDLIADKYSECWGDYWDDKPQIDNFISLLKPGSKVLDIGSGTGYITKYMQEKDLDPVGIDFSQKMLDIATKKYPQVTFLKGDATEIDSLFKANFFDGVMATYCLSYVPKAELPSVLNQINRVLKPNAPLIMIMQGGKGEIIIDEPLIDGDKGKDALFSSLYSKEELQDLLAAVGFRIEEFYIKKSMDPGEVVEVEWFTIIAINNK